MRCWLIIIRKVRTTKKACQYLKVSGQKAMRNNSAWEALNYYRQALSILDRMPEGIEQKNRKMEVLYLSISPLIALGFPENSLSILEQGERLARELDDQHRLFRFHTNIGFFYCTISAIILMPGPILSRRLMLLKNYRMLT